MNKHHAISLVSVICLLCISFFARGITITGPTTVCAGTTNNYTITPTSGVMYSWSITSNGNISTSTQSYANVLWGAAGSGTLSIVGKNQNGSTVETGSIVVTVLPLPYPIITTDAKVACFDLGWPDNGGGNFDSSKCMKACAFNCVRYDAIGGSTSTFAWAVTGGSISFVSGTGDYCIICWNGPGFGSVTVTETTIDGCVGSKTQCVEITESPLAHFVAMPDTTLRSITICDSTKVVFLDKSTSSSKSPIVSWQWDFGDGTYSNAKGSLSAPVTHTYYTNPTGISTTYWVKLTVTNSCGCSTADSIEIRVEPSPRVQIECPRVVCEGDIMMYTANPACSTGTWSVTGGYIGINTPSAIHVLWEQPVDGMGYITYDATSCGSVCAITTVQVPIVTDTGFIEGPIVVCPYTQYKYKLPQWPTTKYNWNIVTSTGASLFNITNDQWNEVVIETGAPGVIALNSNYTNSLLGCSGAASIDIIVLDTASITGPTRVCHKSTVTYTLSGGHTGDWVLTTPTGTTTSTGTNTFSPTFTSVGDYVLTVTGTSFCPPDHIFITVDALPPMPDTIIGPDTFCKGVPTQFTAGNNLNGTVFNWGMLNGTAIAASGEETNITMNTASSGPFVIYLWRENKDFPFCPSDSLTDTVYAPIVNPSIVGSTVVCIDDGEAYSSTYVDGETYEWSIDDQLLGSVISGDGTKDVVVLWNHAPGTAWLICKMRKCGVDYIDSLQVVIGGSPTVSLVGAPYTVCAGSPLTITMTNVTGGYWSYNPPGSSTTVNNSFTGGSFDVTFDNDKASTNVSTIRPVYITATTVGCSYIYKQNPLNITVNNTPYGHLTFTSLGGAKAYGGTYARCSTVSETLYYNPDFLFTSGTLSYQWYHNGSMVGTNVNNYSPSAFGKYWVAVTDAGTGCTWISDTVKFVDICPCSLATTPPPAVSITSGTWTACKEITLTSTYSTPDFVSYSWDWPNGVTSVSSSSATGAVVNVQGAGTYTFKYSALYFDGTSYCTAEDYRTVAVEYEPILGYSLTCDDSAGMRKGTVTGILTKSSIFLNNVSLTVDGNTISTGSMTKWFSVGSHSSSLTVSATGYPVCSTSMNFDVEWPNADFTFARSITCEREADVEFTNTSTGGALATSQFWRFGDGAESATYNPSRVYVNATPSLKPVTLIINDAWGCLDSVTKNVTIIGDRLEGTLTASPVDPCEGNPSVLTYNQNLPNYPNDPDVFKWHNDLDNFATTTYHPINVFESGAYWMRGEDQFGCYVNTPAVVVNVVKVPQAYVSGGSDQCVDVPFTLSGYAGSDPNLTYQWSLGGTSIPGATNATLTQTISTPGTYNYQVTTIMPKAGGGTCTDVSDVFTVTVHGLPSAPSAAFSMVDCAQYKINLYVSSPSSGKYNWSNGLEGSSVYAYYGGAFQVTYTDQYGCQSKDTVKVPKDPKEYMWIFPYGCWSICKANKYTVTGPINHVEATFAQWDYMKQTAGGSTGVHGGTNSWTTDYLNLNIDAPGTFNLLLSNGLCADTSEDMYVDTFGCSTKIGVTSVPNVLNATEPALSIAPNPAQNATRIAYSFSEQNGQNYIEVYDVTGRQMNRYKAAERSSVWDLNLDNYTPGIYQVVMKQNGKVLLNKKLSVFGAK